MLSAEEINRIAEADEKVASDRYAQMSEPERQALDKASERHARKVASGHSSRLEQEREILRKIAAFVYMEDEGLDAARLCHPEYSQFLTDNHNRPFMDVEAELLADVQKEWGTE